MGTKVQVDTVDNATTSSGTATINENDEKLADEFDKVDYLDGSRSATGDKDMDSNRIINLPVAVADHEPLTKGALAAEVGTIAKGDTGPASSTYTSLVDLKAAPASNFVYSLVLAGSRVDYYYETANSPYTADDDNIIKLDDVSLSTGALVKAKASSVSTSNNKTVQTMLDAAEGAFRDTPDSTTEFDWIGISPRVTSPNVVQTSRSVVNHALDTHSALIGSGKVYVEPVNGNDANTGSITQPYETLNYALRTANPSEVNLIGSNDINNPKVFRKSDFRSTDTPGNKIKIVRPIGHCIVEEDGPSASSQTWTSTGNKWSSNLTLVGSIPPATVEYKGWLRPDGNPWKLTKRASVSDITTNGEGWYWDGTTMNIQLGDVDVNAEKADFKITYADGTSRCLFYGPMHILFDVGEGSSLVFNGVHIAPFYNSGAPKVYAKGIEIRNSQGHGVDAQGAYYIFENCTIYASKNDNFHPADGGGVGTFAVEINCTSTEAGDIDTFSVLAVGSTDNGSSMHGLGSVARFGGTYNNNRGPNIVDTGTGKSWNVGVIAHSGLAPGNSYGFYAVTTAVEMYLDTCHAYNETDAEINCETGCTIFRYNTTGETVLNNGTIDVNWVPTNL